MAEALGAAQEKELVVEVLGGNSRRVVRLYEGEGPKAEAHIGIEGEDRQMTVNRPIIRTEAAMEITDSLLLTMTAISGTSLVRGA